MSENKPIQNFILYLAYGNMDNINECRYSLLKYLDCYQLKPPENIAVIIYTDQPDFFSPFTDFFPGIKAIPISHNQMKEWKGADGYIFRIKPKLIEEFCATQKGNFLFCDTDTFVLAPPGPLFDAIGKGAFYMHEREAILGERKSYYFRKWDNFLSSTEVLYNGKKLLYSKDIQIWNSGVIGMTTDMGYIMKDVLSLIDDIYKKFPKHIAEQVAMSYCLQQKGQIQAAQPFIAHYWNLKEFRPVLADFFNKESTADIPQLAAKAARFNIPLMQEKKLAFESLPWLQKKILQFKGKAWSIQQYS